MSKVDKQRIEREKEALRREALERAERQKQEQIDRMRRKREDEQRHWALGVIRMQKEKREKDIAEIQEKSRQYLAEIEKKKKK